MSIPRILVPKEHGAWAVLLVPMIIVADVTQKLSVDLFLLSLSILGTFLTYLPAQILLRHSVVTLQESQKVVQAKYWFIIYFSGAVLFLVPLLLKGKWLLLAFGTAALLLFLISFFTSQGPQKKVIPDLIAVFGLSFSAPASYYTLEGRLDGTSLQLWLLSYLFFSSNVLYVHMKIQAVSFRGANFDLRQRLALGRACLLFHAVSLAIVGTLVALNYTQELAMLAFVPISLHAIYGTMRLSSKVKFKRLGFLLLGHSILFAILLSAFGKVA